MTGRIKKILKKLACVCISILFMTVSAKATLVDSNSSIVVDNIEYYMQTNKSVYDLGEDVEMLYRVTNLGLEDVLFEFSHGPEYRQCDFIVEKDGESIWDTTDWPVTGVLTSFILKPSESKEYTQPWNMTDNNANQVTPGNYDVTGVLNYPPTYERYVPVSVSIDVIPEPSTLLLMGAGFVSLLAYRKKK